MDNEYIIKGKLQEKEEGKFIEKGHRYGIIGTIQPTINNAFVEHVLGICGVDINANGGGNGHARDVTLASTLWQPGTHINEGANRHVAVLSCMDSLLIKHQNTDKELVFRWAKVANDTICNPPLPEKELRGMFDKQCIKFVEEKIFAKREEVRELG
jgi:hypothetical protein